MQACFCAACMLIKVMLFIYSTPFCVNQNHLKLKSPTQDRLQMDCPHCSSRDTFERKVRTKQGYNCFRCRNCLKFFNERTFSPFNRSRFTTDLIFEVVLWRLRYKLSFRDLSEIFLTRGFVFSHEAVREW